MTLGDEGIDDGLRLQLSPAQLLRGSKRSAPFGPPALMPQRLEVLEFRDGSDVVHRAPGVAPVLIDTHGSLKAFSWVGHLAK